MNIFPTLLRSLWRGVVALGLGAGAAGAQPVEIFTLGSGVVGGGYYAAATAICEAVNRLERGALRCSPDPTSGSIYNLDALRSGELDFALVQSDWQRQAVEGSGPFADIGPMEDLRSVMGLYPEAMTVLARRGAGIRSGGDLIGKRVDIGHPASGRHETNLTLFDALNLTPDMFSLLVELPVGAAIEELCAGRIDATLLITGHPSAGIARAMSECDVVLVSVAGPEIDALVETSDDFEPTYIPLGAYAQMAADVPTFSVTATMVTRADMDAAIVTQVVTDVLDSLPTLAQRASVLRGVTPESLAVVGLTAPLHPGARAAFDAATP